MTPGDLRSLQGFKEYFRHKMEKSIAEQRQLDRMAGGDQLTRQKKKIRERHRALLKLMDEHCGKGSKYTTAALQTLFANLLCPSNEISLNTAGFEILHDAIQCAAENKSAEILVDALSSDYYGHLKDAIKDGRYPALKVQKSRLINALMKAAGDLADGEAGKKFQGLYSVMCDDKVNANAAWPHANQTPRPSSLSCAIDIPGPELIDMSPSGERRANLANAAPDRKMEDLHAIVRNQSLGLDNLYGSEPQLSGTSESPIPYSRSPSSTSFSNMTPRSTGLQEHFSRTNSGSYTPSSIPQTPVACRESNYGNDPFSSSPQAGYSSSWDNYPSPWGNYLHPRGG